MPEFAQDLGHGDAGLTYGMLLGADAAGALTAGFVLEGGPAAAEPAHGARAGACCGAVAIGGFAAVRRPIRSRSRCFLRRLPRARVQRDGADAGADQRARRRCAAA